MTNYDRFAPVLDDAAFHGPAADYVQEIAPNTEADPVAMLLMTLAWCGSRIGNGTFLARGSRERHPACIWPLLVGKTATGRKRKPAPSKHDEKVPAKKPAAAPRKPAAKKS